MKLKSILLAIIVVTLFCSCGSKKAAVNKEELIKEVNSYVANIDNNKSLKSEITEGALTDAEGFKDIGTFEYTVYYDADTNELFKIKNVEKTNNTITETYYFQENDLVYVKSVSGNGTKTIYFKKGKVFTEMKTTPEEQQLLLAKAKRFQKGFRQSF